jgi:hypothetical protein
MSCLTDAIIKSKDALLQIERDDRHAAEEENIALKHKIIELERKIYYLEQENEFKEDNYQKIIKDIKKLLGI